MQKHHSESAAPTQFVPSGRLTGTYFILFTNLDKDATWQTLKDWLRAGDIKTEHIEITKKTVTSRQGNDTDTSLSGWMRFQGRENYQKATTRIQSHDYKKRRLRIYAHNADKPFPCALLRKPSAQTQEESGPNADASFPGQTAPTVPRYPAQHGPQTVDSFAPLGMPYDNTLQAPTQSAGSNVAVSPYYNNPAEIGGAYQVPAKQNSGYYVADPTTYHHTDPGYDSTVQYGSVTQALVHGMDNTSLNNDPVPRPQQQRSSKPEGSYQTTREGKERYKDQKRSRSSRPTIPSSSESSKPAGQQHSRPGRPSSSKRKGREEHQPVLTSPVVVSSDYSRRASKSEEKRQATEGPVIVDSASLHRAAESEVKRTAPKSGEKRPAITGPVVVSSDYLHRASRSEGKRNDSKSEGKTPAKTGPVIVNGTSPYRASDPTSRSEGKISAKTGPVIVDGTSRRASKPEGEKRER